MRFRNNQRFDYTREKKLRKENELPGKNPGLLASRSALEGEARRVSDLGSR